MGSPLRVSPFGPAQFPNCLARPVNADRFSMRAAELLLQLRYRLCASLPRHVRGTCVAGLLRHSETVYWAVLAAEPRHNERTTAKLHRFSRCAGRAFVLAYAKF